MSVNLGDPDRRGVVRAGFSMDGRTDGWRMEEGAAAGSDTGAGMEWEWEGRVQGFAWLDSWTEKQAISGRDLYVWLLPQILRAWKLRAVVIARGSTSVFNLFYNEILSAHQSVLQLSYNLFRHFIKFAGKGSFICCSFLLKITCTDFFLSLSAFD